MAPAEEVAEWRLRGASLILRLLPVLACVLVGSWALDRRLGRTDEGSVFTMLSVEAVALGVVLLSWVVRTRVRLVALGVEVRELRTRTYAWEDIVWVEPSPSRRRVRLGFRDGSIRTLPAPARMGQGAARGFDRAVAVVRRHCDLHADNR